MLSMHDLGEDSKKAKKKKRVGRGPGSGKGKTAGRGTKGAGSRSGYKRRFGTEGGGIPLHMRLPIRGFKRGFVVKKLDSINLWQINEMFEDGEMVSTETLQQKGFLGNKTCGIKILGTGDLSKKVKIEAHDFSRSAREKLDAAKIEYKALV